MNIYVVLADDWEGVYTEGTLYDEAHSINWLSFLSEHVGETIESYSEIYIKSAQWLNEEGGLPFTLEEFKQKEDIK